MKIYLHEITDDETELEFSQEEKWLLDAVSRVDEQISDDRSQIRPGLKTRPVSVQFSLRKVDEVVVVNGSMNTHIELVCSRCATPFKFGARPSFSTLFCKDPVMGGIAHLHRSGTDKREPGVPMGQNKGHARHAHDYENESGGSKDLDITYLATDFIDLGEVVTEQLQLQVPFQPLCKEECKGICSNCGADMNTGRCACAKVTKASPFSVLRDLKL